MWLADFERQLAASRDHLTRQAELCAVYETRTSSQKRQQGARGTDKRKLVKSRKSRRPVFQLETPAVVASASVSRLFTLLTSTRNAVLAHSAELGLTSQVIAEGRQLTLEVGARRAGRLV